MQDTVVRPFAPLRARLARFAMALAVLAVAGTALVAVPAPAAEAAVVGDQYPSNLANAAQDSIVDPWNFYNRECTSFVAWRLNSTNKVDNFTNQYGGANLWWGNANTWGTSAKAKGIRVDNLPAVGSVAWSTAGAYGHVAWVAAVLGNGKITIEEYNYRSSSLQERGRYNTRTMLASAWTGFIHVKDMDVWPPSDGTFVTVKESGQVYRIAGGAPVYVSWAPFGGSQQTQTVTAAKFASLPTVPKNGTYIRGASSGNVYTMANGAPIHVTSWAGVGGEKVVVNVDDAAISNAGGGGVWQYLRSRPSDGFLRGAVSGRVFRVVAGHPYHVGSWDPYGGEQAYVNVDDASLDSCDHLNCDPWGSLDSVKAGKGSVTVAGWAQDPSSNDPVTVRVYADGALIGTTPTRLTRTDVDDIYHRGIPYGYSATITAPVGSHQVCVAYANNGVGADTAASSCVTVTVAPLSPFTGKPTPTITGIVRVDEYLTAATTAWTPAAPIAYQWSANGAQIQGATSAKLKLAAGLTGQRITVTTTATKTGYTPTAKTSVATVPVAPLSPFADVAPWICAPLADHW
jgi:surface antigen